MPTPRKSSEPRPALEDAPAGGTSSVASARGDAGESGALGTLWALIGLRLVTSGMLCRAQTSQTGWPSCYRKSLKGGGGSGQYCFSASRRS